jgi:hypothetical protein
MQRIVVFVLAILTVAASPIAAQRRGAATRGSVTFAVSVSDPSGAPIPDVRVTLSGPAQRSARTEGGRLAFENLPAGTYRFRFDKDGFIPFEKELAARGSAPIPVKVTLTPAPAPPPQPVAPPPPLPAPPLSDVKPVVLDMPAFIEKNYIGRSASKLTPLGCATDGASTLIQINEPIAPHAHSDADEFIYVIAGEGTAKLGDRSEPLGAGVYLLIPRALTHAFTAGPKKPLVMISTRAGDKCGA